MAVGVTADDVRLRPVWAALHERACAGNELGAVATVRITADAIDTVGLLRLLLDSPAARAAGRTRVKPVGTDEMSVPVRRLIDQLGLAEAEVLAAVVRVAGPVVNRAALRSTAADRRSELWADAGRRLPGCPQLLARMRAGGVNDDQIGTVARQLAAIEQVIAGLPYDPPRPLPTVAYDATTDPHFFDRPREMTSAGGRLVAAIAETFALQSDGEGDAVDQLLAQVGIIKDRVSSVVTTWMLDLRTTTGDRWATSPLVALTRWHLTADDAPLVGAGRVVVSENPSLVEVAIGAGWTIPILCTHGTLRSVDHTSLRWLTDQQVTVLYVGDADGAGIGISRQVAERYGAQVVDIGSGVVYQEDQTAVDAVWQAWHNC